MRLKRFFSAALSAALLLNLCACAPAETVESGDPPASGSYSGPHFSIPGLPGSMFGDVSGLALPPPPAYDKEHRLYAEIPALTDGLEMPVIGATGYTSVKLPLWPSIPDEPEDAGGHGDSENSDSSQTSSGPESFSGEPATGPASPAPVPDESAEPGANGPADLTWDQSIESTPDGPIVLDPELSTGLEPVPSEPANSETDPVFPEEPDPYEGAVAVWEPGTAFVILEEDGDWWHVARGDVAGWIEHRYCMINLPDVIPSIIYDDTNSYSSLFVSCGKEIPGVTGEAFYESLTGNARLDRQEFMMPLLYSAARHVCAAQQRALAEGNCLVVYQTFRPYETQRAVVNAMSRLAKDDPEVKAGVSTPPWSMAWFINTGISNHQRGFALDVSMVKVYETETAYIGSRPYLRMTDYEDYRMPTAMHELSIAAISTVSPGSSQLSETMNEPAIALRGYFTASGLSPLASEWWHFNDNKAMQDSSGNPSNGRYFITECLSCLPEQVSDLLELYATEPSEEHIEESPGELSEEPMDESLGELSEDPMEEPSEGPFEGPLEGPLEIE